MRDTAKEDRAMEQRRELMLETGFRIFAERGIKGVSMQDVADACPLGIATLYRYFSTKLAFAIAIAAKKWREYYEEVAAEHARRGGNRMTAAEELDFYLDAYLLLYREHPDLLRFHQNFVGYISHERPTEEQLADFFAAIKPFRMRFHKLCEKGGRDGTIHTDETEQTMFNTTLHIMLAVCGRFAQGVLVKTGDLEDLTRELTILKSMILARYVKRNPEGSA